MLKLAILGAQTLLGRELAPSLEAADASVLPLHTGPLTQTEEEGDLVVFAPVPALLEGLDLVILVDTPQNPDLLSGFPGRILDLREDADPQTSGDPMPLAGEWPPTVLRFRGRPALELALGLVPALVEGLGDLSGTHLRSVAMHGEKGLQELLQQTRAVLHGDEPETGLLGYRAAFDVVPQAPRGTLVEVRVPVFHGDLLILHLRAAEGATLKAREAPQGIRWVDAPPSSREVAVSQDSLAHLTLSSGGRTGVLMLGCDPILWGLLRPTLRLLGLGGIT